jgi:hypothetical protein
MAYSKAKLKSNDDKPSSWVHHVMKCLAFVNPSGREIHMKMYYKHLERKEKKMSTTRSINTTTMQLGFQLIYLLSLLHTSTKGNNSSKIRLILNCNEAFHNRNHIYLITYIIVSII